MRKKANFLVILLAAVFMLGFIGCSEPDGAGGYAQYYLGTFRNNQNGLTTVQNNTNYDMLLFEGEFLGSERIVGAVRAGGNTKLNFENETDYATGGYKLLRAVRQSVFEVQGSQSKPDHSVMVSYRRNAPTTVSVTSTTDGNYHYIVNNMSSQFSLQLRENSAQGKVVAFLTKGERNRVIQTSSPSLITLYPVWIGYSTQTMEIVEFAPTEPFTSQSVQPISTGSSEPAPPRNFPSSISSQPINFPVMAPTAVVRVMNTFDYMAMLRSSQQPYNAIGELATATGTGINSGNWRSFNVPSEGGLQIPLNIYLMDGNISVPVRFEDQSSNPIIKDGFYYHINFQHTAGQPVTDPASYKAVITEIGEINTSNLVVSP